MGWEATARTAYGGVVDAIALLLGQHARLHSAAVAATEADSLEDSLIEGVGEADLRAASVPGLNPPAWIWWHVARTEDALMHAVVAGDTQVFDADGWSARLGVERRDIGTGMDRTEVAALAGSIDLAALRVYRAAVGAATRAYVEGLGASDLDRIVGPEGVERAREQGALGPRAAWVGDVWQGTTLGFLLGRNLLTHNAMHVGEVIISGPMDI